MYLKIKIISLIHLSIERYSYLFEVKIRSCVIASIQYIMLNHAQEHLLCIR